MAAFVDIVTAVDLYYICIVISWGRVVFYRGNLPMAVKKTRVFLVLPSRLYCNNIQNLDRKER